MRGSVLSNNSHTDKSFIRRTTESAEAKRKSYKANYIKIKNDDVSRVFHLFENATVQNSMVIARAFTEARETFQKHIVLEKQVLEKEKPEKNYGHMPEMNHKAQVLSQIFLMQRSSQKAA